MADSQDDTKAKQPNLAVRLWKKSGLTVPFLILALKGALPSTICLAAYRSPAWSNIFTTLGYLVAIISHLSLCVFPRGKFMQLMLAEVIAGCLGCACALLASQCAVSARTKPPARASAGTSGGPETPVYDAAANATAAVWLAFFIFLANCVKCARPQLLLPMIQFSIFVIIGCVYAPNFPDMDAAMLFDRRLLLCFVIGQGIATGVHIFIFPTTSRNMVEKQFAGLVKITKGSLGATANYMSSLTQGLHPTDDQRALEAKVKAAVTQIIVLLGKTKQELAAARAEPAFGKLNGDQLFHIFESYRQVIQPVMGLSSLMHIIQSLREHRHDPEASPSTERTLQCLQRLKTEEWDDIVTLTVEAFGNFQSSMFSGLDHIAYTLELEKKPGQKARSDDVEDLAGKANEPGDVGFAAYLEVELRKQHDVRAEIIKDWADNNNVTLPMHFHTLTTDSSLLNSEKTAQLRARLNQHQLYLVLYIHYLTYSTGRAILDLVRYADGLEADGTMKHKRIILPKWKVWYKFMTGAYFSSNKSESLSTDADGGQKVYLGDALKKKKNPEHLPPSNAYEKFTDKLRMFPTFLASETAAFGFRAMLATMSLAIIAYLRETRTFFLDERGTWAVIMIAISMDPHSGSGVFGFLSRVFGTLVAMVAAIVIWYMCDQKAAAILVIFCLYQSVWIGFILKHMEYAMVGMIAGVTVILIVGYELEVTAVGKAVVETNGQEAYKIYILAPYRLACVVIGLATAFIWTFFPYPITTHGAIREDIGSTLYMLANYYSCVHTTLESRLSLGPALADVPENHPARKLDKARVKTMNKMLQLLGRLQTHKNFSKFDITFGGRFPAETYWELIESLRTLFTYLALIGYSSRTFTESASGTDEKDVAQQEEWLTEFRKLAKTRQITSHKMTTSLCMLSAAIKDSTPLPPYLDRLSGFNFSEIETDTAPEVLSIEHLTHPSFAGFAMGEVTSSFIQIEMSNITRLIKSLVGEVDFSFHVVSTMNNASSETTLWDRNADFSGNMEKDKQG